MSNRLAKWSKYSLDNYLKRQRVKRHKYVKKVLQKSMQTDFFPF
jgi:hypothetical protein